MRISPPAVVTYECSFEQAAEIYARHSLRHCEPLPLSIVALSFHADSDRLAFKLMFGETINFIDEVAITFPYDQDAVERFLDEQGVAHRVIRQEILWVSFWDSEDQAIFDQAFARV
jgi:hypothetical protein